jgi:hypothetical protein
MYEVVRLAKAVLRIPEIKFFEFANRGCKLCSHSSRQTHFILQNPSAPDIMSEWHND